MRLVCIDHYFEQDIQALEAASGEHRCWAVDYAPFLALARRFFPEKVFTGIEEYFRPEHATARAAYRLAVEEELARLHGIYRFDALLAPSDTFFWIRAVIEACQDLGIPFIVLQKEATIPPGWLEGPAREWGRISPFIADHMLVSSSHHRDFWVNSGVRPDQITVTGQPRFDIYAGPQEASGSSVPPTVLFLTYDVNAYLPVIDRTGLEPWGQLRSETEAILLDVARSGVARVLVKAHPQPAEDQSAHLETLGREPGVEILDPRGDVRRYILDADIVVGFQTTALLEALAAGRPTVYTWWTDAVRTYEADLIPFHRQGEALVVADAPAHLRQAIERGVRSRTVASSRANELVTRYLGPIDGRSAERCWHEIERLVRAAPQTVASPRRLKTTVSAAAAAAAWTLASGLSPISYPGYWALRRARGAPALARQAFRHELDVRRRGALQRLVAASTR